VARRLPPRRFESSEIELASVKTGTKWFRLYSSRYPDPLGFGFSPSRFSDPRVALAEKDRFGVIYFGSSLKVCFLVRVLRDRRNGRLGDVPIPYPELERLMCAEITIVRPLNLVDLCCDNPVKMAFQPMPFEHRVTGWDKNGRLPSGFTSSVLMGFFILLGSTRRSISLYTMLRCRMCAYLEHGPSSSIRPRWLR
jgi:hypothetical protein